MEKDDHDQITPAGDRVIISGAGIGGLALAQGLKKAGIPFTIYERSSKSDRIIHAYGYQILLLVDGALALKDLLPLNLYRFLFAIHQVKDGKGYQNCLFRRDTLEPLLKLSLDVDFNQDQHEAHDLMVEHSILREILLEGIEDQIQFDRSIAEYIEDQNGVTIKLDNGQTDTCSVLIGADGINSFIRSQKLPNVNVRSSNVRLINAQVNLDSQEKKNLLPKSLDIQSLNTIIGHSPIFGIFVSASYPKEPEVAAEYSDLWRRLKPVANDSCRVGIWTDEGRLKGKYEHGKIWDLVKQMVQKENFNDNFIKLINQADEKTLFTTVPRSMIHVEKWPSSRVTLLGDAAHAMLPFLGRGANTALEDALTLTNKLKEHGLNQKAIIEYEKIMRPRGEYWMKQSERTPLTKPIVFRNRWIGSLVLRFVITSATIVARLPILRRFIIKKMRKTHGYNRARYVRENQ